MKRRLHELTRSQYVVHALDWMFERPIFKRRIPALDLAVLEVDAEASGQVAGIALRVLKDANRCGSRGEAHARGPHDALAR